MLYGKGKTVSEHDKHLYLHYIDCLENNRATNYLNLHQTENNGTPEKQDEIPGPEATPD